MAPIPPSGSPDPCVLIIFGASGDLTSRKLIPVLSELSRRGQLPEGFRVLGVSRTKMTDDEFRAHLLRSAAEEARGWSDFAASVHYASADATDPESFGTLVSRVESIGRDVGIDRANGMPNVLFYLSVAPQLYEPIIDVIGASGMVTEGKRWCSLRPDLTAWQRIIVEKPFGTDLASAQRLNQALGRVFEEDATYRIDHYLGKELVQNISVMRFANAVFEPLWNARHIDHVQVTAAESIGVGSRAGNFYDKAGAVRDMVQSHLMQVLALVAMEPPSAFTAEALMREKIKLFGSAVIPSEDEIHEWAALGRYGGGSFGGADEPAYAETEGVDPDRKTETFGAMRVQFDNWRWSGCPFYLRSGKRMNRKLSQIVVQFKDPPADLFKGQAGDRWGGTPGNRLVVEFAPGDRVTMQLRGKVPGSGLRISAGEMELDYVEQFGGEPIEAYGPLLLDAMRGDRTLFKHRDEVEGGWRIAEPVITSERLRGSVETYDPGSWGPVSSYELLARKGRAWYNPGVDA